MFDMMTEVFEKHQDKPDWPTERFSATQVLAFIGWLRHVTHFNGGSVMNFR